MFLPCFLRHRSARPNLRKSYARLSKTEAGVPISRDHRSYPEDEVIEAHGVKVYVDPKSMTYLDGTELDFVREGLNEGLQFRNPNVSAECGCGASFTV